MKKFIKDNYKLVILFILFLILGYYFPIVGDSLKWSNLSLSEIKTTGILKFFDISFLSSLILYIITKIKIIRILFIAMISLCFFVVLKNIVNKNNNTLLYMGIFLFLIISMDVFKSVFAYTPNFVYLFLGMLFLLIIELFISNKSIYKLSKGHLFILGLLSSLIHPSITIMLFVIVLIYLIIAIVKNEDKEKYLSLFLGIIMGSVYMMMGVSNLKRVIYIPNIALNAIENVVPNIYTGSFIIYFITLALLLFLSIKIFIRGNIKIKILDLLAVFMLAFFAVVFLVSKNIYMQYIAFILNMVGSIYVLYHANNSIVFKRKISLFYLSKIIYLLLLLFVVDISAVHNFVIYIFDILIILEIVDYVLPNNFLDNIWYGLVIVVLLTNIYIYRDSYIKYNEMNTYVKRQLSCDNYEIKLPIKYKLDNLYNYIPNSIDYLNNYKKYNNIKTDKNFYMYFPE